MTRFVPAKLWQRNMLGGVVALIAVTILAATDLYPSWVKYRDTTVPAVVVPAGQRGGTDGQTWSITDVRHLNSSGTRGAKPLPTGTVLQVVTIDHTGGPEGDMCTGFITDGNRRWQALYLGSYGLPIPDGVSDRCTKPGPVQFSFLLPHDAVPTAIDVADFNGRIRVRLEL